MYRVQFPICDPPEGWEWTPCIYSFDTTNTPALTTHLKVGEESDDIPLLLDTDAVFYWMGTKLSTPLEVQLKVPETDPVQDEPTAAALVAGTTVPTVLETPGFGCFRGAAILVKLRNPS